MLLEDIFSTHKCDIENIRNTIQSECSQFFAESYGVPLMRSLPCSYSNIKKVKARVNKSKAPVSEVFELAFHQSNFFQKAIFAYPNIQYVDEDHEPFYVFPINGYKYVYCSEIHNSKQEHSQTINTLLETISDEQQVKNIMSDVLQYSYVDNNLLEGIQANAEIIFYNIPYYYAVKASVCKNYKQLIGEQ